MMPTRIKSLLLGILMGFVAMSGYIADAQQVGNRRENTAHGNRFAAATTGVEVIGQVHAEQATEVAHDGKRWLKGRKMLVENVLMKDDAMKGESVSGGRTPEMNSGATHSVGKCDHPSEGGLNVQSKMGIERLLPSRANMVGLLSFSSDYHVPRPHPPKNN